MEDWGCWISGLARSLSRWIMELALSKALVSMVFPITCSHRFKHMLIMVPKGLLPIHFTVICAAFIHFLDLTGASLGPPTGGRTGGRIGALWDKTRLFRDYTLSHGLVNE